LQNKINREERLKERVLPLKLLIAW